MVKNRTLLAVPPGATLREQLADRQISPVDFAGRMRMSETRLEQLLNGETPLTPELAAQLEAVLGTPARFWRRLEAIYREKLNQISQEENTHERHSYG